MSLKFSPKAHRYWMDGKPVTGVTTLMKLPNQALMYWAARSVAEWVADRPEDIEQLRAMGREPMVNALKGVPWEKRDQAAIRGTEVHGLAERVVHGEEVDVPPHVADHVDGYARWLDAFDVKPLLTEHSVGNRKHWYAGRFDLIAEIAGQLWLLDVKTSADVYADTALQLAAYRNAEFYVSDNDIDTEHPLPAIERTGVIHVTDSGTTLHPFDAGEKAFKIFQHMAYVNKSVKTIDQFKLEPVYDLTELERIE